MIRHDVFEIDIHNKRELGAYTLACFQAAVSEDRSCTLCLTAYYSRIHTLGNIAGKMGKMREYFRNTASFLH